MNAVRQLLRVSLATALTVGMLPLGVPERPTTHAPNQSPRMHLLYAAEGDVVYSLEPRADDDGRPAGATFTVSYTGFDDASRRAFDAAIGIWSRTITSPVPIRIRAAWVPLGDRLLGRAGPTVFCQTSHGIPGTYYPAALADRLNGTGSCADAAGETAEIEIEFNSDIAAWDFGTTGAGVAGKYSFVSAALHEIAHGLGFGGLSTSTRARLSPPADGPRPAIFDRFVVSSGQVVVPGCIPPLELQTRGLALTGRSTLASNADVASRLEPVALDAADAPGDERWLSDAGHAHVDDRQYSGTPNGLMTSALNTRETYMDVGPLVRGVLQDLGWVSAADVPGAAVLIAPFGLTSSTTPEFVWTAATGATTYQFSIYRQGNACGLGLTELFLATDICEAGTCRVPAPVTLPYDWFVWSVRALNADGAGPWASGTFSLPRPTVLPFYDPTGTNIPLRPTYRWNSGGNPAVTQFLLNVFQGTTLVINQSYDAYICDLSDICYATPSVTLSPATTYTARVQLSGLYVSSEWTATVTFTTGALPQAPTLTGPSSAQATPAPTYAWNASPSATSYALWVQRSGTGAPLIHTTHDAWAVCSGGSCRVTPRTELPDGAYTWWVQPTSAIGTGNWSSPATFSVTATVPTAATPGSPFAGVSGTGRPAYRWTRVPNATWYYLWVDRGGSAPLIQTWYFGADICGPTVCSATPATGLAPGGTYRWFVQTWSTRGTGPWTPATIFSIATTAPAAATLVSPVGIAAPPQPTYVWNRTPGASWYYLWVSSASGAIIQTWYRAEEVCSAASATCSATPAVPLATGSYWFWIQTYNDHGYGPWSAGGSFTR